MRTKKKAVEVGAGAAEPKGDEELRQARIKGVVPAPIAEIEDLFDRCLASKHDFIESTAKFKADKELLRMKLKEHGRAFYSKNGQTAQITSNETLKLKSDKSDD